MANSYDNYARDLTFAISLSTLVVNSRNQHENIWLPKRMHLDKQGIKNQNRNNLPQCYNYSSNNAISSQLLQHLSTREF